MSAPREVQSLELGPSNDLHRKPEWIQHAAMIAETPPNGRRKSTTTVGTSIGTSKTKPRSLGSRQDAGARARRWALTPRFEDNAHLLERCDAIRADSVSPVRCTVWCEHKEVRRTTTRGTRRTRTG